MPTNLLSQLPSNEGKEVFETIFQNSALKIERIISFAQTTPEGEWYDQDEDEFVLLVEGSATIFFEDNSEVILKKNDYIHIEAHKKHRVTSTSLDALWLCIFFKNQI